MIILLSIDKLTLAEAESEAMGTGLALCSVSCSRKWAETVLRAFTTTGPGCNAAASCSACKEKSNYSNHNLLCLAEFVLVTLLCPVAAVHHEALLGQVLQGEGEDDMGGHGKDNQSFT